MKNVCVVCLCCLDVNGFLILVFINVKGHIWSPAPEKDVCVYIYCILKVKVEETVIITSTRGRHWARFSLDCHD